jgi:hypothetical protein
MQERGIAEVRSALRRIRNLHALGRVREADFILIQSRLEEAEIIILGMTEYDADGEEIIDG